ncbi:MAG TPA: MATE family efflux transporter, partial [Candidatus Deferrimicrobium sp.]|nr:MATE family efflux transporter [Candidatus Deferrimicrobium sp.]
DMSWAGSRLIITSMVAPFGTAVVAAYGVGNQVTAFGIMLLVGIGLGLSALIGHNLGAAKHDRARKTADQALLLGAGVMIIFGAITFVFARDVIGLFFDAAGTVEVGRTMLRIFALGYPFLGAFIMMEEIFMGAGWNTPPMVMNLITSWGLQAAPVLVLANHFALGETSVWWTLTLANVIMACAFYLYYRRGRWLTARV